MSVGRIARALLECCWSVDRPRFHSRKTRTAQKTLVENERGTVRRMKLHVRRFIIAENHIKRTLLIFIVFLHSWGLSKHIFRWNSSITCKGYCFSGCTFKRLSLKCFLSNLVSNSKYGQHTKARSRFIYEGFVVFRDSAADCRYRVQTVAIKRVATQLMHSGN